jgi:peptidoglycan/xylan/chitin deacetylase (PgdA/CDA1 family)
MPLDSFNKNNNRYVSFTFDDGLINSAQKVNDIIFPHKATFYIVTGWLKPNPIEIKDKANIGFDHGDFESWQKMSNLSHEIGSHTVAHLGPDGDQESGYIDSLEYIKKFSPTGPYSLSLPYGLRSLKPVPIYDSIRLCRGKKIYNRLNNLNLSELFSFDPFESGLPLENIKKMIHLIPNNSWLILQAHGLDNEGFLPWPSEYFKKIFEFLLSENFKIKTVREMTQQLTAE